MSTVISVRVRKELKDKAKHLGIDIRKVVEKSLEEAIKGKEKERLIKAAKEILEIMKEVSEDEWVKLIKESRYER